MVYLVSIPDGSGARTNRVSVLGSLRHKVYVSALCGAVEGGLTYTERPLTGTQNFSEQVPLLPHSLILEGELSSCPALEFREAMLFAQGLRSWVPLQVWGPTQAEQAFHMPQCVCVCVCVCVCARTHTHALGKDVGESQRFPLTHTLRSHL